jgi:protease IV
MGARAHGPSFIGDLTKMIVSMVIGGVVLLAMVILIVATVTNYLNHSNGVAANANIFTPGSSALQNRLIIGGDRSADKEILVVPIRGTILAHRLPSDPPVASQMGFVFGEEIRRQLVSAATDDAIAGVLLQVATPGGSIGGSQAIHEGISTLKSKGKPIAVHIDGFSASGGVWATAAADAIFADPGSTIGSVGVIGPTILEYRKIKAFQGVETDDGIAAYTVSAGRGKDIGNPFRAPTDDELALLAANVDEFYGDFLLQMESQRGIPAESLRAEYGAGMFSNDQAEAIGFIDGTRSLKQATDWVYRAAQLTDPVKITTPRVPIFRLLPMMGGDASAASQDLILTHCTGLKSQVLAISERDLNAWCPS